MPTKWTFDKLENTYAVLRGEDCIKKLFKSLRERTMKIILL